MEKIKFIDLFCGVGGFHYATTNASSALGFKSECVFASDIAPENQKNYAENFGIIPAGDITKFNAKEIPDHNLLLAGFPCQPFSIYGHKKGFEDTRGTLFFDIARILDEKKPTMFALENVKQLKGNDKGRTLSRIIESLQDIGYQTSWGIFDAKDFGLPQKRERIFIVGCLENLNFDTQLEQFKIPMRSLSEILEKNVDSFFYASDKIKQSRLSKVKSEQLSAGNDTIWHENKSGNISAYPFSCALRAGASYNYLLVNGERRLTGREMFRLQGFPDSHKLTGTYTTQRFQAGNALPIPIATAVLSELLSKNWSSDDTETKPKTTEYN